MSSKYSLHLESQFRKDNKNETEDRRLTAIHSRQPQIPNAAYGPSKTVLAWYGVRLHAEEEWLSTFVIDPGWAQTEMGNGAAEHFGYSSAPVTEEDSVNGIFKIVTAGTRGEYGGKVVLYTGEVQVY